MPSHIDCRDVKGRGQRLNRFRFCRRRRTLTEKRWTDKKPGFQAEKWRKRELKGKQWKN